MLQPSPMPAAPKLTPNIMPTARQWEVIQAYADGLDYVEIGPELGVSGNRVFQIYNQALGRIRKEGVPESGTAP